MQLGFLLMSKNVFVYGTEAMAAYGIGNKVNGLITLPSMPSAQRLQRSLDRIWEQNNRSVQSRDIAFLCGYQLYFCSLVV